MAIIVTFGIIGAVEAFCIPEINVGVKAIVEHQKNKMLHP